MSKPIRNDRRGRSASPLTRPRGRLPKRVYWVRRVLVLGVATLLVLGITRLLSGGGGDTDPGAATIVRSEPSDTATSATTAASPTTGTTPGATATNRKGLARPDGPCDPADVLVTPTVDDAHVARPVRIVLHLTSIESPACTFDVSSESVIVRLLAPKRSEPLWTTQQCGDAVPERTVVARQTKPGRVWVEWNGRHSDSECSNLTDWVFPNTYTAEAIAVGSTRATSSEFVLGLPVRPTVTRTPKPSKTPSQSPPDGSSESPSGGESRKPAESPTG
jgi:hypothetical protein